MRPHDVGEIAVTKHWMQPAGRVPAQKENRSRMSCGTMSSLRASLAISNAWQYSNSSRGGPGYFLISSYDRSPRIHAERQADGNASERAGYDEQNNASAAIVFMLKCSPSAAS